LLYSRYTKTILSVNIKNKVSKHIPEFTEKFKSSINYTSHSIQEQLISLCADSVRDTIIQEIGDGVFGVMCDEARLVLNLIFINNLKL